MKGEKGAPRVGSLRLPSASRAARERQHVERSAHSTVEARARRPRFAGSGFGSSPTRARVGHLDLRVRRVSTVLCLSVSPRGARARGLAWRGCGLSGPPHCGLESNRVSTSAKNKSLRKCESVRPYADGRGCFRACAALCALRLRRRSDLRRVSCARVHENRTYYASTLGNSRVVLMRACESATNLVHRNCACAMVIMRPVLLRVRRGHLSAARASMRASWKVAQGGERTPLLYFRWGPAVRRPSGCP